MPLAFARWLWIDIQPMARSKSPMRPKWNALCGARFPLQWVGILLCSIFSATSSVAAQVEVDAATRHQVIDGFGSSERLFDDPHVFADRVDPETERAETILTQDEAGEVMDLLYIDLGLTRVRPLISNLIEKVNDNDDPFVTDLSAFDFAWLRNDGHVDYVKDALDRGASNFFISPLQFEKEFITEENPEEYVEWAMTLLNRWRSMGLEVPYYSILNEPSYPVEGEEGIRSPEYSREVIKLLGARLRAQGFDTMIVVADDVNSGTARIRSEIILADEQARQYIAAIAFHLYGDYTAGELNDRKLSALCELAASYGLPLWMTEFSGIRDEWQWGLLMHDLLVVYDVSAVDILFGAFGQQAGGSSYIRLLSDGPTYLGPKPTKKYYYAGQYSRFVKPGAQRVGATSTDPAVRVSAYENVDGEYVIVAINTSDDEIPATFRVENAGVPESALQLIRVTRTSDTEDWADLPAPTVSQNSLSSALPGRSFTTFVLPEPGRFAQQAIAIPMLALWRRRSRRWAWNGGAAAVARSRCLLPSPV